MKNVLGVDLGMHWHSTGTAIVSFGDADWINCRLGAIAWPNTPFSPAAIAEAIVAFALENEIRAISLDGPQGWRDPRTHGNFVGRDCERLTRTPGKTGTFGTANGGWIRWIECSIEVFDWILKTPTAMLANSPNDHVLPLPPDQKFYVLECFPKSTWRRAGLRPLPGHHIDSATVRRFARDLQHSFGLPGRVVPESARYGTDHDNLQALVAALPAAGLLGGPCQAVSNGLPARIIAASNGIPMHRAEGIIWDGTPRTEPPRKLYDTGSITIPARRVAETERGFGGSLMSDSRGIERGARLFRYLVDLANQGKAVGVGYGSFIAYLHGVKKFFELAARPYRPADTETVIGIAYLITDAAGGRQMVTRSGCSIAAGMDTFIWRAESPYDRPIGAWQNPRGTLSVRGESKGSLSIGGTRVRHV
jgi:hypothetical protein